MRKGTKSDSPLVNRLDGRQRQSCLGFKIGGIEMKRTSKRRKLIKQRIIGVLLLGIAVCIGGVCAKAGEDATAYCILAPLALWIASTRKVVIL